MLVIVFEYLRRARRRGSTRKQPRGALAARAAPYYGCAAKQVKFLSLFRGFRAAHIHRSSRASAASRAVLSNGPLGPQCMLAQRACTRCVQVPERLTAPAWLIKLVIRTPAVWTFRLGTAFANFSRRFFCTYRFSPRRSEVYRRTHRAACVPTCGGKPPKAKRVIRHDFLCESQGEVRAFA